MSPTDHLPLLPYDARSLASLFFAPCWFFPAFAAARSEEVLCLYVDSGKRSFAVVSAAPDRAPLLFAPFVRPTPSTLLFVLDPSPLSTYCRPRLLFLLHSLVRFCTPPLPCTSLRIAFFPFVGFVRSFSVHVWPTPEIGPFSRLRLRLSGLVRS